MKFFICIAATSAVIFSAGCKEDQGQAGWWQGEQERIELNQQLKLKKYRFEQSDNRDFEELEKLLDATDTATSSLRSLRQQRLSLSDEVASLDGKWGAFRESTIKDQRHRAIGNTFEVIYLISGRKYQNVTVSAIEDAGVTIRHADGSARLCFADLNSDQRLYFGLEEDLAIAAMDKEVAEAASYDRWIDEQLVIINDQKKKNAEIAKREELAAKQERSKLASEQAIVPKTRTLALATTALGNRSRGYPSYFSTYRTYPPIYHNFYHNTPSYNHNCRMVVSPRSIFPQFVRPTGTGCASPSVLPKCQSFINTTIPLIP